jgi:membrane fusion protein (multidrug efflux system)
MEAHEPDASPGHSPEIGVVPHDRLGPALEPSSQPGGPSGAGPMRPEIDPASTRPGAVKAKSRIVSAMRRLVVALILVVALAIGGVLGLSKMGVDVLPAPYMQKIHASVAFIAAKAKPVKEFIVRKFGSYFQKHDEESHQEHRTIVVTTPNVQDVTITESFVCQIRSQRHIEVRALEPGYLQEILIREGQAVKDKQVLFRILPILYKARLDAEQAEAELARMEWEYNEGLRKQNVVSQNQLNLLKAKLDKALAKVDLAKAELGFTEVKAPYDGIVDRLLEREGSLIHEGDILTTLSDNSVMWVYFNVPEKYYLEYMANRERHEKEDKIELVLANGDVFTQAGTIGAIEADVNNENGNAKFRADFPNPKIRAAGDRLLRNGQTGTIKVRRPLKDAVVIPQRAIFELLDKRYVWVVDEDNVAHQTLITIKHELEDIFVVDKGLKPSDKIVLEGVREVEDRAKVEYEFRKPAEALDLKNQKFHAE